MALDHIFPKQEALHNHSAETNPSNSDSGEKEITIKGQRERRPAITVPPVSFFSLSTGRTNAAYSPDSTSSSSQQPTDMEAGTVCII